MQTPAQLYKQQKIKLTSWQCRHLKGYSNQLIINPDLDETESYNICNQCHQILERSDIEQINETLNNFKKKKKCLILKRY